MSALRPPGGLVPGPPRVNERSRKSPAADQHRADVEPRVEPRTELGTDRATATRAPEVDDLFRPALFGI